MAGKGGRRPGSGRKSLASQGLEARNQAFNIRLTRTEAAAARALADAIDPEMATHEALHIIVLLAIEPYR